MTQALESYWELLPWQVAVDHIAFCCAAASAPLLWTAETIRVLRESDPTDGSLHFESFQRIYPEVTQEEYELAAGCEYRRYRTQIDAGASSFSRARERTSEFARIRLLLTRMLEIARFVEDAEQRRMHH